MLFGLLDGWTYQNSKWLPRCPPKVDQEINLLILEVTILTLVVLPDNLAFCTIDYCRTSVVV
ncbi:hypothetical protein C5167_031586 [Papaver somniferum]|uniref:Uncharacterized protein n=1 Tax=Papaver somniferum TaxID=3469 RepID=A0A4Y7K4Q0_PAPSO|nr:hypothetical protein C5167_031586 [Papaver somniferum]